MTHRHHRHPLISTGDETTSPIISLVEHTSGENKGRKGGTCKDSDDNWHVSDSIDETNLAG